MIPAFVINLPYRTDRRREMERQLANVGWTAEIFPAIRPETAHPFPSVGSKGCFLSHLAVLKHAWESGFQSVAILEDDVDFAEKFTFHWSEVEKFAAAGLFDLLYAGHIIEEGSGIEPVPPSLLFHGAHFLIFSRPGMKRMIDGLEAIMSRPGGHPLGGPMHVDGAYCTIRSQNTDLMAFAHFPSLGRQRRSRSDITETGFLNRVIRVFAGGG